MPEITIQIREKHATALNDPTIVCGNSDYTVVFDLDSEWQAYAAKTARFNYVRDGVRLHQDVLFQGSGCAVPVMHDVYEVEVGIYAGDIRTSTPARIPCVLSSTDDAAEHPQPAPDIYDQLLALLSGLTTDVIEPAGDLLRLAEGLTQDDAEIGIAEQEG